MRRVFWGLVGIGIGVAVGVAAVRWASRTKRRLSPRGAASAGGAFADRLRDAIEAGREEMARREAEFRAELKLDG